MRIKKIGYKYFLYIVSLVFVSLIAWNFSGLLYITSLGAGQLKIIFFARPVSVYLSDPDFPDSLKNKLEFIHHVRQFGIDSLGLKDTDNYTKLYVQQEGTLMWIVQGCPPYSLSPKLWSFPIVGQVPYKGFFSESGVSKEKLSLQEKGYDVRVSRPAGWSTLGWFSDPILSDMLRLPEGELASLIIHEMTHTTIYFPSQTDYNENCATFIGNMGSELFLASRYGKESMVYQSYIKRKEVYKKKVTHFTEGAFKLDSLYKSFTEQDSDQTKRNKKRSMIDSIAQAWDTIVSSKAGGKPKKELNNAYFMSYLLYHGNQEEFKKELYDVFSGDLRAYILSLRKELRFQVNKEKM